MIADLPAVMARVPKGDGHRGGITAFVVEAAAAGITVERRNAFMACGAGNGVTRFHRVGFWPPAASARRARPKIAVMTLSMAAGAARRYAATGKLALKVAQGVVAGTGAVGTAGRPARGGGHADLFIAATTYAMEAVSSCPASSPTTA